MVEGGEGVRIGTSCELFSSSKKKSISPERLVLVVSVF